MRRRVIIYPIIMLSLFLIIVTTISIYQLIKMPGLLVIPWFHRTTSWLALAGLLSIAPILVAIRALSQADVEINEDFFP